jgi:DNA-binding response OmpR family regulator
MPDVVTMRAADSAGSDREEAIRREGALHELNRPRVPLTPTLSPASGRGSHRVRVNVTARTACLRGDDQEIELPPKAFEVLRHLAENAGRLVPKHELREAVWPKVLVGDNTLMQCIRELRKKLGDDQRRPRVPPATGRSSHGEPMSLEMP